jgi:hypothetical protein
MRNYIVALGIIIFIGCNKGISSPTNIEEDISIPKKPIIDRTEPVEMADFMMPRPIPGRALTGQIGTLVYAREDNIVYCWSWGTDKPQHYSKIKQDGDIFLLEDRTWRLDRYYTLDNFVWAKASMRIGETYSWTSVLRLFNLYSCDIGDVRHHYAKVGLVDHRYQDLGGDLGETEVIEWDYLGERYLYAKNIGLVGYRHAVNYDSTGWDWWMANKWINVPVMKPAGCKSEN